MFLPLLHWSPGEISPLDSQSAVRKTQFIRYSRSARQVRKKEPLYTTFLETPVPTRLPPCISCEFYARLGHFSMKAATEKMTDETPNFWSVYREGFIQFDYRIQMQRGTTKLVSAHKLQSDLPMIDKSKIHPASSRFNSRQNPASLKGSERRNINAISHLHTNSNRVRPPVKGSSMFARRTEYTNR